MDAITRAYIDGVRPTPVQPKIGARVGFLTESASTNFLRQYHVLREAGAIVPAALNVQTSGQVMLCEAVEPQVDVTPTREKIAHAAFEFLKADERLDEDDLEVLMNMVVSDEFVAKVQETAAEHGVDVDTGIAVLFNPPDGKREMVEELLLNKFDQIYPDIAEEVEAADEAAALIANLYELDDAEFDSALEALDEDELQALAPIFEGDDEELNELSKDLLGRYVVKAYDNSVVQGHRYASSKADVNAKAFQKIHRRSLGIRRAVRRLTKEDVSESAQVFSSLEEWKDAVRAARGNDVEFRRVLTNGQLGDTRAFLNGTILQEAWDGERGVSYTMALSSQPKSVKKTLKDILRSGFVPGSQGDRMFAALHRVELTPDANGNGNEVFNGSNVKQFSRSPRYGYSAGQDAKKYDLKEKSPILDTASVAHVQMQESRSPWGVKVLSGLRRGS